MQRQRTANIVQPALTLEQEQDLMNQLPNVRSIARRIHSRLPQNVDIDDLFSAGFVGLVEAYAKFNPARQIPFGNFAQFRIRGAIMDSLRSLDWAPRDLRSKGRTVKKAIQTATSRLGHTPSEEEVAAELKTSLEAYQQLMGDLSRSEIATLHGKSDEDAGDQEMVDVAGRPEDDPLFLYLRQERQKVLTGAIEDLPERERLAITLYYHEEKTMAEIGVLLEVSPVRVTQIHASAVRHLRSALSGMSSGDRGDLERVRTGCAKAPKRAAPGAKILLDEERRCQALAVRSGITTNRNSEEIMPVYIQ